MRIAVVVQALRLADCEPIDHPYVAADADPVDRDFEAISLHVDGRDQEAHALGHLAVFAQELRPRLQGFRQQVFSDHARRER
ncbi:hypothetical protein D3C72_872570 [compost metagenome]